MTSDEATAEASRRDPRAFDPLVERHGPSIHAYLTRRCGPQAGIQGEGATSDPVTRGDLR